MTKQALDFQFADYNFYENLKYLTCIDSPNLQQCC